MILNNRQPEPIAAVAVMIYASILPPHPPTVVRNAPIHLTQPTRARSSPAPHAKPAAAGLSLPH